jgi:2-(1,2-epoxy-1,2-dihydrophenyl)acetyl-CoA isomerase
LHLQQISSQENKLAESEQHMQYKRLICEKDKQNHIAVVTLNRPNSANSFDFLLMEEIDHVFRDNLELDDDIRAIVLTGAGKYFSAGVDLSMFVDKTALVEKEEMDKGVASSRVGEQPEDVPWGKGTVVGAVAFMQTMRKPIIAAVNGAAAGMGVSFALACDIRIASENARFAMMFVKRGLAPDTAASFTLPRIVGFAKAKELLLTGETIDAAEAYRIGMVSKVVPHDELMPAAKELACKIGALPPMAVALNKQALHKSMAQTDIIAQMMVEIECQDKLMATEDFKEAAAAFMEKRPAVFKGN